jgi:bifunctional enzyme CysN/CysC
MDATAAGAVLALERAGAAPDQLRFVACGSVDDGKSTLIGRLLADTGAVPLDQIAALERWSKKFGSAGDQPDYALLLDGLESEREQGITIDVAYRYFSGWRIRPATSSTRATWRPALRRRTSR